MKTKYILSFLMFVLGQSFLSSQVFAQVVGFTQQDVIKKSGVKTDADVNALSATADEVSTSRIYYDGSGRPIQQVAFQASPVGNKDIIQIKQYNSLGQEAIKYLPYANNGSTGSYRATAATDVVDYYNANSPSGNKVANGSNPFSQQVFENSPLARVVKSGSIGSGFQPVAGDHFKTMVYRLNTSADGVLIWGTDGTCSGATYAPNLLSVGNLVEEDGQESLAFTDIAGRLIMKRQVGDGGNQDTYYVYNNGGNLIDVIPPKALEAMHAGSTYSLSQAVVSKLIFQYFYDDLGRIVRKVSPSTAAIYYVYDPHNRLVLVQDGNLRGANQWNYIKYDAKNHAISQGLYTASGTYDQAGMQGFVDNNYGSTYFETRSAAGAGYYTNNSFPTSNIEPLAYSYYDDYYLTQGTSPDFSYTTTGLSGEEGATAMTRGLLTMVSKRSVGPNLSNIWITNAMFYDKRNNVIQVKSNNQLNYTNEKTLTDVKTTTRDFIGRPRYTQVIKATGNTVNVITRYNYDAHSLTSVDQSYNGGASYKSIVAYNYNELGQIILKKLGASGAGYLQNVDYRYNLRGQLVSINNSTLSNDANTSTDTNDLFGMQFTYESPDISGAQVSWSGRISEVKWMAKNGSGVNSNERSYLYKYNKLNQVTDALYADRSGGGAWGNAGAFNESDIHYDVAGNIMALKRNAQPFGGSTTQIDDLTYNYDPANPNQLTQVSDASANSQGFKPATGSVSYGYDANSGNLVNDPYKGLTLSYNVLNRTQEVDVASGGMSVKYTYLADGTLTRKVATGGGITTTTDYIDGFIYTNAVLNYFGMPEGRVTYSGANYVQQYVIADQQGNTRVTFQDNGSGSAVVIQENSYYAFGMVMPTGFVTLPNNPNKNLYNGGSEWQSDFNNMPDFYQTFYRNYDAALGRWMATDPKAEVVDMLSPYQYAGNNPIMQNDPMGDISQAAFNFVLDQINNGIDGNYSINDGSGRPNGGSKKSSDANAPNFPGSVFPPTSGPNAVIDEFTGADGVEYYLKNGQWGYYRDGGYSYYNADHSSKIVGDNDLGQGETIWVFTPVSVPENANQGAFTADASGLNFKFAGSTLTTQNGGGFEMDDGYFLDKIQLKVFNETVQGKEGLFNVNHTVFTSLKGVERSADVNINVGLGHIRLTDNIGIAVDVGLGGYGLRAGLSLGDGVMIGSNADSRTFELSARPGLIFSLIGILATSSGGILAF